MLQTLFLSSRLEPSYSFPHSPAESWKSVNTSPLLLFLNKMTTSNNNSRLHTLLRLLNCDPTAQARAKRALEAALPLRKRCQLEYYGDRDGGWVRFGAEGGSTRHPNSLGPFTTRIGPSFSTSPRPGVCPASSTHTTPHSAPRVWRCARKLDLNTRSSLKARVPSGSTAQLALRRRPAPPRLPSPRLPPRPLAAGQRSRGGPQ